MKPRSHHVPPGEAYAHVDRLIESFPDLRLTKSHIARLAGVHREVLTSGRPHITIETADRLLAVRPQHVRLMPPRHIDARPSRERIQHLMRESHASTDLVGSLADVSGTVVRNILNGQPSVRYPTHVGVTSLTLADVEHVAVWVDREPVRRQVHALRANGWTQNVLEAMTGHQMRHVVDRTGPIHSSIARQVQFVYDRIGDEVGPYAAVARRAQAEGHLPPIHWNDDMTLAVSDDDPDVVAQTKARTALCVLALTVQAQQTRLIASRLGISERTVSRYRSESGLRVQQVGDGLYEPIETWPGQFAVLREIARDIHVWSTLTALDTPDLDYVLLRARVKSPVAA